MPVGCQETAMAASRAWEAVGNSLPWAGRWLQPSRRGMIVVATHMLSVLFEVRECCRRVLYCNIDDPVHHGNQVAIAGFDARGWRGASGGFREAMFFGPHGLAAH